MVTLADGKYGGGDEAAQAQSVLGDMLCLLSAVVYGAYTVSLRWGGGGRAGLKAGEVRRLRPASDRRRV